MGVMISYVGKLYVALLIMCLSGERWWHCHPGHHLITWAGTSNGTSGYLSFLFFFFLRIIKGGMGRRWNSKKW